jgi:hypothetical protein
MIAAHRRFVDRFGSGLSGAETALANVYLESLRDGAAFVAMVDQIKAYQFGQFLRTACQRPLALRHFHMPLRAKLQRFKRRLRRSRFALRKGIA